MDITKEYILMCSKATEIQELAQEYQERSIIPNLYSVEITGKAEKPTDVWMPRQDQLQDMYFEEEDIYKDQVRIQLDKVRYKSFEIWWLDAVMWHKHRKCWDRSTKTWVINQCFLPSNPSTFVPQPGDPNNLKL